ncbi:MAG TPA: hypothetical protein ENI23_10600 [bacterium]|nr:hypothetical protein [bacterium]
MDKLQYIILICNTLQKVCGKHLMEDELDIEMAEAIIEKLGNHLQLKPADNHKYNLNYWIGHR